MRPKNDFVTVLTPTYNRHNNLVVLYESLCNQTITEFTWMVVDDGSTDETESLISNYMAEDKIKIIYIKKINGGKHTALNTGISRIRSILTFIVDSDDILPIDAVETILCDYPKIIDDKYCGLAYLRGYSNKEIIGDSYKKEGIHNLNKVRYLDKVKGDKAEVWKTSYLKEIPFPEIENEKFLGEHYVWCQLSEQYDMFFRNKIIYICEYLDGGLTKSGRKLRINSPLGGMESSKVLLKNIYPFTTRFKNAILYITYYFFARDENKQIIKKEKSILLILVYPFGYLLYRFWKRKYIK